VSTASQQLSSGASSQAASLEETSASLEEVSAGTRQNADNARVANQKAQDIERSAHRSKAALTRMTGAMGQIHQSAQETAKIVKTIDEIAFQTNLLALNAAVEAARAGEAGKGFAVVAEEVRNLAQRSAEAARQTAELIEASQRNADNGVSASGEVEQVLIAIATDISQMGKLLAEVDSASQEQARGVEQVNQAVADMDRVTQSNAAGAEQSAAASEELSAQAVELDNLVHMLRVLVRGASGDAVQQRLPAPPRQSRLAAPAPVAPAVARIASPRRLAAPPAASKDRSSRPQDVIPLDDQELKGF
jgi:methyl-accepting chemotaxis protein